MKVETLPTKSDKGKPTFYGLFLEYSKFFKKDLNRKDSDPKPHLRRLWSDDTYEEYIRYYTEYLIPSLSKRFGKAKAAEDYEDEELKSFFEEFKAQKDLSDATIGKYVHLFWTVYKTGSENQGFTDRLQWEVDGTIENSSTENDDIRMMKSIKRSFSIEDETKIARWFKDNIDPDKSYGEVYGILFMFCLALRNNEAAALTFSCFHKTQDTGLCYVDIYQSTVKSTNETKTGGKTANMFRRIPVFPFLFDIVERRRKTVVSHLVESQGMSACEAENTVARYIVACRKRNFAVGSNRDDLTRKGRDLLWSLKASDSYNDAAIRRSFRLKLEEEADIEEKDPTAYVFRRNGATHLYSLGMTASQIQYYMGHEVENPQERRSFYANMDRLRELWRLMMRHPFNLLFSGSIGQIGTIELPTNSTKVNIRIAAKEPNDEISFRMDGDFKDYTCLESDLFIPQGFPPTVDVREKVLQTYRRIMDPK